MILTELHLLNHKHKWSNWRYGLASVRPTNSKPMTTVMVFSMNQQYNETDSDTKKLNQKKILHLALGCNFSERLFPHLIGNEAL